MVGRQTVHEEVEQGFPFDPAGSQQFLDDFENRYDVAFGRLAELRYQQNRRCQEALCRIVEERVLPIACAVTARHDDGLGDDFCVLFGPGFVGQLALLLI